MKAELGRGQPGLIEFHHHLVQIWNSLWDQVFAVTGQFTSTNVSSSVILDQDLQQDMLSLNEHESHWVWCSHCASLQTFSLQHVQISDHI